MEHEIYKVCFEPARRPAKKGRGAGTAVMAYLPGGKVAFPSGYFWRGRWPWPKPYEIWLVRVCGSTDRVAYLAPVERLAEPPFGPGRLGGLANASLVRFARLISGPVALYYRRKGNRPQAQEATGGSPRLPDADALRRSHAK